MFRKIAVFVPLVFASACAVQPVAENITPQQAAAIEVSCTTILGLEKGEYQYQRCRESLVNTVAALAQGEARLVAYDACRGKGQALGSAALATCMLDSEHAAPVARNGAVATLAPIALPRNDLKLEKSYYVVTHDVQWRREQYACAQLGLTPGSASFTHCVASLDADVLYDNS